MPRMIFSGVTKSGRVWRKVPESGARCVASGLLFLEVLKAWTSPLLRNTVSQRSLATGFSINWRIKRPRVCRRTASMHEQIYFDIVAARVLLFPRLMGLPAVRGCVLIPNKESVYLFSTFLPPPSSRPVLVC